MRYESKLQQLVSFRGTKKQIAKRIQHLTGIKPAIYKFKTLPEMDYGFEFNLGQTDTTYLDFDLYALKTNATEGNKPVYFVIAIHPSY